MFKSHHLERLFPRRILGKAEPLDQEGSVEFPSVIWTESWLLGARRFRKRGAV